MIFGPNETISLISLVINVLIAFGGLLYGIAKVRKTISDEILSYRDKLDSDINSLSHNVGEVASSLRQKITEVELFVRDHFYRRDEANDLKRSMVSLRDEVATEIKDFRMEMVKRLDRMEVKIDTNG